MHYLGQTISETQQHAARLDTPPLREEIHRGVDALNDSIRHLYTIPPGYENAAEAFDAAGEVIAAALMTALYLCELVQRPAPRTAFVQTDFSVN